MKKLSLVLMFLSLNAQASFGEIDLLVKESIQNHFSDYRRSVDLSRFDYFGKPKIENNLIIVRSSVWAEHGFNSGGWGWHDCTSKIQILSPGQYRDLGSSCGFELE